MVKKAKMQKTDSGEFCLFSICVLLTSLLPPRCSVLGSIPVPSYLMVNRLGGAKCECLRQGHHLGRWSAGPGRGVIWNSQGGALRAAECPATRVTQAALSSEGRGMGGGARSQHPMQEREK